MTIKDLIAKGKTVGIDVRETDALGQPGVEYCTSVFAVHGESGWLFGGYSDDVIAEQRDQLAPKIADLIS